MPDTQILPVSATSPARPGAEMPRSAAAEQARGPKIVPAFRFVPSTAPALAAADRFVPDYARAARAAGGGEPAAPRTDVRPSDGSRA